MISQTLQVQFNILESAVFPEWQKASPKMREKITKSLGEYEGIKIIEEAEKEVLQMQKNQKII